MKRRHDDNLKIIEAFLSVGIKINMLESIYVGQSQYKTLKIFHWLDINKKTGQAENSKLIEEIHTEKDLQRHFSNLSKGLRAKYNYPLREVVGFSYVQSSL